MTLYCYVHAPQIQFQAQVNQASFTYPIDEVTYDSVSQGSIGLTQPGMQVWFGTTPGADDLGRQRLRKPIDGSKVYFGRSSQGVRDGEVDLADNVHITIGWQYSLFAKQPNITDDGTIYKDSDIPVGTWTTNPPPVANAGPPMAGTVDPALNKLRVMLPPQANNSFATADGATITGYQWFLPTGATLATGYALTDSQIEVDFDPGFYYVRLQVTDSNGKTHEARTPIFARDPDNDETIPFQITSHITRIEGQEMTIRPLTDLDPTVYPDNAMVLVWEDEPSGPADRDHMIFWGFHHTDPASIRGTATGTLTETTMLCLDVAGKLSTLPGLPQIIQNDAYRDTSEIPAITWTYMTTPHIGKFLHYLLHWHSTALEIADWTWPANAASYPFIVLDSNGSSIYDQVDRRARSIAPDHRFTCDTQGRLAVIVDPWLQDVADRTAVNQVALFTPDIVNISWVHQRSPSVYWLRAEAIGATATKIAGPDGDEIIPTYFCIAPGLAPGQGQTERRHPGMLAISQQDLNIVTGHRYARMNADDSVFDVELSGGDDRGIEPARLEPLELTFLLAEAAERGLYFTDERMLPLELRTNYRYSETGLVRTVRARLEREVSGSPAVTTFPPDIDRVDDGNVIRPPSNWVAPLPGDPSVYYGTPAAYILWDGTHVMRTWNLLAATPVWELVDAGITGAIMDGQYVHVDADTVGMWLMTADAIWWCGDIMAGTPSWSAVLTIGTVRASDVQIVDNPTEFYAMNHYASEPGYLIVATAPGSSGFGVNTYAHSYSWHTHDYGQTWTQVDMDNFIVTTSEGDTGYAWASRYCIAIYASSPIIWMMRTTNDFANASAIFKSTDLGDTWTKEYEFATATNQSGLGLLAPFPDVTDPSYANRGNSHDAEFPSLYVSTDAWATATQRTKITGYDGLQWDLRPNSNTFEPNHVLAYWLAGTAAYDALFESADAGVSWTEIFDPGRTGDNLQTPNGWPPDTNKWVDIYVANSTSVGDVVIRYTDDKFATTQDKRGNLASLITDWTGGSYPNGFFLPRVGTNA